MNTAIVRGAASPHGTWFTDSSTAPEFVTNGLSRCTFDRLELRRRAGRQLAWIMQEIIWHFMEAAASAAHRLRLAAVSQSAWRCASSSMIPLLARWRHHLTFHGLSRRDWTAQSGFSTQARRQDYRWGSPFAIHCGPGGALRRC